jgi:hypothetical protein
LQAAPVWRDVPTLPLTIWKTTTAHGRTSRLFILPSKIRPISAAERHPHYEKSATKWTSMLVHSCLQTKTDFAFGFVQSMAARCWLIAL